MRRGDVTCATKPKPGRAMLAQTLVAAGMHLGVGGSVYGGDYAPRRWLEERRHGYVLAVISGQRLGLARRQLG